MKGILDMGNGPLHLRAARPVSDLNRSVDMYTRGLGLQRLGGFKDHQGFDGAMVGHPGSPYHLEFTRHRGHPVLPAPTHEDLLVFYVPDLQAWEAACQGMLDAGFRRVASFNPYWDVQGATFEDPDGYRTVLQRAAWPSKSQAASPLSPAGRVPGQDFVIRDFEAADFEKVAALWEATGLGGAVRGDDASVVLRTLAHGAVFLVLESTSTKAIGGTSWMTQDARRIYLHHFGIAPGFQGRGLGKALLAASLERVRGTALQIKLEVHRGNEAAIALYRRFGFTPLGDYDSYIVRDPGSLPSFNPTGLLGLP